MLNKERPLPSYGEKERFVSPKIHSVMNGLELDRRPQGRKNLPEPDFLDVGIAVASETVAIGLYVGETQEIADVEEAYATSPVLRRDQQ